MTGTLDLEPAAPDLIDPAIGYRQWRILDGRLYSVYTDERWAPSLQVARCRAEIGSHAAPAQTCTCGIHAWYRPCPPLGSAATRDWVAGAVALWGHVELHATGMRAQYATVAALALPISHGTKRRRVLEVADAFGVEAVPARRLRAAALAHGAPIPDRLRPRASDLRRPVGLGGRP